MNVMNTETRIVMPLVNGNRLAPKAHPELLSKGIIGQQKACKKLVFYVESNTPKTPFPTLLFTGSQGLGKSYLAAKVARALGRKMVEVNCGAPDIQKSKDFIEKILMGRVLGSDQVTLFLDEAHKLSSEVTTLLLSFLNPNPENKNLVSNKHYDIEFDFSKINVILATTDAYRIFKPLRDRCEDVYFHCYSDEELYTIVSHYLPDIKLQKLYWKELAQACRGRARDAFLLAQNIRRYCAMKKTSILKSLGWDELKTIFEIYPEGLNDQEIDLLRVLADNSPISCHNIAIRMGVNTRNIEEDIEIRLKEIGFIRSTPKGRVLTEEGVEYLQRVGIG